MWTAPSRCCHTRRRSRPCSSVVKHALLNGTFEYGMIGKGSKYGPPYPSGPEVDAIHLQLLGKRQLNRLETPSCAWSGQSPA